MRLSAWLAGRCRLTLHLAASDLTHLASAWTYPRRGRATDRPLLGVDSVLALWHTLCRTKGQEERNMTKRTYRILVTRADGSEEHTAIRATTLSEALMRAERADAGQADGEYTADTPRGVTQSVPKQDTQA